MLSKVNFLLGTLQRYLEVTPEQRRSAIQLNRGSFHRAKALDWQLFQALLKEDINY